MAIVDCTHSTATLHALMGRIEIVQLRDLSASATELMSSARRMHDALAGSKVKLLINSRVDIALAARADGVHLPSHAGTLQPKQIRTLYAERGLPTPLISISCHTLADVSRAHKLGVDLILFGPIFEKRVADKLVRAGIGVAALTAACAHAQPIPVLALGGVTESNAPQCTAAGATGFAAIRSFA